MCWGWAEACNGGNSTIAAPNQLGCPSGSQTSWCCNLQAENCTETSGQINICWAKSIVNPNKGVPQAAAVSIAASSLEAISSAAIASRLSALVTATSKPISTSATTTPNAASASASASATSTPLLSPSGSASLSGGVIAGVVIAAFAGVVLIALAALFVYRRQMRKIRAGQPPEPGSEPHEKHQQQGYYDPPIQNEAPATPYRPPVEMGVEEQVHEMPSQTARN